MNEATGEISEIRLLSHSTERKRVLKAEFERVALPQRSYLYKVASYLTKKRARAEDLVQETYLRAFRFFDKFEPGTNCKAWLLSILRHLFVNRYRHRKNQPKMVDCECLDELFESTVEQEEMMERGDPENLLLRNLMHEEVEDALNELPADYRRAVNLVDIDELSYQEAAKVMDCPIGTLRSRVSRGRRMLETALQDYAQKQGLIRRSGTLIEGSSLQD
ncbi:MAG: sigma-70 family RNA polymerase sigma factor [Candidatus Binatia bacterium]